MACIVVMSKCFHRFVSLILKTRRLHTEFTLLCNFTKTSCRCLLFFLPEPGPFVHHFDNIFWERYSGKILKKCTAHFNKEGISKNLWKFSLGNRLVHWEIVCIKLVSTGPRVHTRPGLLCYKNILWYTLLIIGTNMGIVWYLYKHF